MFFVTTNLLGDKIFQDLKYSYINLSKLKERVYRSLLQGRRKGWCLDGVWMLDWRCLKGALKVSGMWLAFVQQAAFHNFERTFTWNWSLTLVLTQFVLLILVDTGGKQSQLDAPTTVQKSIREHSWCLTRIFSIWGSLTLYVALGQLSHWGSCLPGKLSYLGSCPTGAVVCLGRWPPGAVVPLGQLSPWGSCHLGSCSLGSCLLGQLAPGQLSPHQNLHEKSVY